MAKKNSSEELLFHTSMDKLNLDLAFDWMKKSFREDVTDCPPPLRVNADFIVNISDVHIPFHHEGLLQSAMRLLYNWKKKNPTKIAALNIAGDLCDFTAGYKFGHSEKDSSMRATIRDAGYLLTAFAKVSDLIIYTPGNHDDRFAKKMDKYLGFDELVTLIRAQMEEGCIPWANFLTSSYNFAIINDSYMTVHPKNYSRKPCTVPVRLATLQRINVIVGHTHHEPCFTPTECGKFVGIENGCSLDMNKVGYCQDVSAFPAWGNGFTILEKCSDGKTRFRLFSERTR